MAAKIEHAIIRWDSVPGATGWEIRKDGAAVATAGMRARTTKVLVDESTLVEIVDLPARTTTQALLLTQEVGA